MDRRKFIKGAAAVIGSAALPLPAAASRSPFLYSAINAPVIELLSPTTTHAADAFRYMMMQINRDIGRATGISNDLLQYKYRKIK